ncbi:MAG: GPR1/FUN34/YaaH family transporter [Dehalococcoidia bacterium]
MAQERPPLAGDPTPFALSTFSISAVLASMVLAEVFPFQEGVVFIGGPLWTTAGVVQITASVFFLVAGATFAAAAFGIFGFFWVNLGLLILLLDNGVVLIGASQSVPTLGDALAAFLVAWNIWFFILWIATLRLPLVWFTTLGSLVVSVSFIAAGWWSATDDLFNDLVLIGGIILFSVAIHGFYLLFSNFWVSLGGKPLPMGPVLASWLWSE